MGIDKDLISAYQATEYRVWNPSFSIHIGSLHPEIDQWMESRGYTSWAFITAWNPRSTNLSRKENNRRQKELYDQIQAKRWDFFSGAGIPSDLRWEAEESVWIPGISVSEALELAAKFNQNAIVFGILGKRAELVWCK